MTRTFEGRRPDVESLLVAFLSELVYYQEQENLAFDTFDLRVAVQWLKGANGRRADRIRG